MKLTAHTKTMNKTLSNVIAVITALSLVFLQVPIFGLAKEARADAAKEVSTQAEKSGTVDVKFSFDNAYVVVDGQVIAPPASKVTIPAGSDLVFTAEADNGYEIDSVVAKIGGSKTTLATSEGKCRISGSNLLDGKVSVSVNAVALPEEEEAVEEEVVAPKEKAAEGEGAEGEKAGSDKSADKKDGDKSDEVADSSEAAAPAGDESADAADKSGEAAAKSEEAADSSADAAAKSEEAADSSADAADKSADAAAKSDAAADAKEPATKKVYKYSDSTVEVTATLQKADAIPDDAKLVVRQVTQNSSDYNYDAYMGALNNGGSEYTEANTILYDVAFLVKDKDGKTVEIEPADGIVSVSFKFKDQQLSEGLEVRDASGVEVTHLQLKDSAKKKADTTADATNITANDVVAEPISNNDIAVTGANAIEIKTDSFSVFAISYTVDFTYEGYTYSIQGEGSILLSALFKTLGIQEDVADVASATFSNPKLVKVEKEGADWRLTSLKPFTSKETLTVKMLSGETYIIEVTDAQSYTVTVKTYDYDGSTPKAFEPKAQGGSYWLYAYLTPKGTGHNGTFKGWASKRIDDLKGKDTKTVVFDQFTTSDWSMDNPFAYDASKYDVTIRMYWLKEGDSVTKGFVNQQAGMTDPNQIKLYEAIDGYKFLGSDKYDLGETLKLKKWNGSHMYVDLEFDKGFTSTILPSDNYYIRVKLTHKTGQPTYFFKKLDVSNVSGDSVRIEANEWRDHGNGNIVNGEKFTGGETGLTVDIVRTRAGKNPGNGDFAKDVDPNSCPYGINEDNLEMIVDGGTVKDYRVSYVDSGASIAALTSEDSEKHELATVYKVRLTKIDTEDALTPEDILGDAVEFGIVADQYIQNGHTETNFAVNTFSSNSNVEIDGSGDAAIPIYAGAITSTELWLSGNNKVPIDVFVGNGSKDKVRSTSPHPVNKFPMPESDIKSYVDGLIAAGRAMSASLASKTTMKPAINKNNYVLDTTSFPDYATVYVDASLIAGSIAQGGWKINKLEHQSIVINLPATGTVRIGEFYVNPNDGKGEVQSTTAALDGDAARNQRVDDVIFEHITFNMPNASEVDLKNASGLFLSPNANSVTQDNGAGWILAKGTVESNAEWHFYRHKRDYTAKGDLSLSLIKKVVDAQGADTSFGNKVYKFKLYNRDDNGNAVGDPIESARANALTHVATFQSLKYNLASVGGQGGEKTFKYVIYEDIPGNAKNANGVKYSDATDAQKAAGGFVRDGIEYTVTPIKVNVVAKDNGSGTIDTTVMIENAAGQMVPVSKSGEAYPVGTATNTKQNDDETSVTVSKVWQDGNDKHASDNVTVKLQQRIKNTDGTWGNWSDTIRQKVSNDWADVAGPTTVQLGANNEWRHVFAGLPKIVPSTIAGDGEDVAAQYKVVETAVNNQAPEEGTVTIDPQEPDANATAFSYTITNAGPEEQTGSLKIKKILTENGQTTLSQGIKSYLAGNYRFKIYTDEACTVPYQVNNADVEVSITVGNDGAEATSEEVANLPVGTYWVKEVDPGNGTTAEPVSITVEAGKTGEAAPIATITNNINTGGLEVSKSVDSSATADKNTYFDFTVTLKNPDDSVKTSINGLYGNMSFTNGVAEFRLKHNESITASGLPAGTKYLVEEAGVDGFTTGKAGDSGVIERSTTPKATFTNTRELGNLTVSKKVMSDATADQNQKFNFEVTLKDSQGNVDEGINGAYGGMTFNKGVANVEITGSNSVIAEGLPTGLSYVVTESAATDFTLTGKTGDTGTIVKAGSTAAFTNTRNKGGFSVKKTVSSDAAADNAKEFQFTATLLNESGISGEFGDLVFTDGVATFSLTNNQTKSASGLPIGVRVEIKETSTAGFVVTPQGGVTTGSVTNPNTVFSFTNTKDQGGLVVSKAVNSTVPSDLTKEFDFTVTITKENGETDTAVSGTYGGMNFDKGVAKFKLSNGQTMEAKGLPKGAHYKVEEAADAQFITTYTGETGVIGDTAAQAAFTNTRETGDLEVSKAVVSDAAADASAQFTFTVTLSDNTINGTYGGMAFENGVATFKLKGGQKATAAGLPTGVGYTVTEAEAEGFELTGKTGDTGTISTAKSSAAFTNTRETGDLEVSKAVVSDADADASAQFTFTVTLSDTSISKTYGDMAFENGVATFKLKGGQKATATGLPTGVTYTVTEADASGFTQTAKTGDIGTISTAKSSASFENTRVTGGLKVTKTVSSILAADATQMFNFTVTLKDATINGKYGQMTFKDGVATFTLAHGQEMTAEGLPTGVGYEVTEEAVGGFTTTSEGATGTILNPQSVAAFTNARIQDGSLIVSKTVQSPSTTDSSKTFEFEIVLADSTISGTFGGVVFTAGKATVTLKSGESKTITGLPIGLHYTVTEKNSEGFTVGKTESSSSITTAGASSAITNTRNTGDLEITKRVVSDAAADVSKPFSFTITLDDKGITGKFGDIEFDGGVANISLVKDQTMKATGLPTGVTYTVTEADAPGFTQTAKTGDTGTISTAKSSAEFTNTRETGDLEVSKAVVSDADADASAQFTFTVTLSDNTINGTYGGMAFENGVATFKLKGGQKATATGLPTGVGYTVTEGVIDGEPFTVSYDNASGSIAEGKASTTITNTRKTGNLEISKTVVSDAAADASQKFQFEIVVSGLDNASRSFASSVKTGNAESTATDNVVFDENGKATIELVGGQSRTIEGLPTGVTYTVTEASNDGFTTKVNGQDGAKAAGAISEETASAAFENTRKAGDLEVKKLVASSTASDSDLDFNFKVTLTDNTINGTYGEGGMTFANGVATFTLKHNESMKAEGLPTGIGYTVVETTADGTVIEQSANGFVVTKSGDTGAIGETASIATFTNTKQEGGLIVSKSVQSDVSADHTAKYSFKVTLSDTTINGVYGGENGMSFTNGVAEFTLADTQTKSATGLPAGIRYTVEEQLDANAPFAVTKTGDTGTIEESKVSSAEFANARKTGDLVISKAVVSDVPADKTQKFQFGISLINKTTNEVEAVNGDYAIDGAGGPVTFTNGVATIELSDNETVKIIGLPAGLKYSVTEALDENSPLAMTATGSDGEIEAGKSKTSAFTNTRAKGNLSVSKTLVSTANAGANQVFTFTVTLTNAPVNATYKLLDRSGQEINNEVAAFADGVATIGLKGGETKTIVGLPANVAYEIAEGDFSAQGYVLGEDRPNASGTIASDNTPVAQFTNTRTEVKAQLYAYKELQGAKRLEANEFTFQLFDEKSEQPIDEARNNGTGHASFDELTFGAEDVATSPHVYTIKEVKGDKPYITYDESEHKIAITVSKNENGTLKVSYAKAGNTDDEHFIAPAEPTTEGAVQEGSAAGAGVKFVNTYSSSGEFTLATKKTVDSGKVPEADAGKYTFAVYKSDAFGNVEENAEPLMTATNNDKGDVVFDPIKSSSADAKYYLIKEVIPEGAKQIGSKWVKDGIAYDQGSSLATVTGVDNGNGTITFTVKYDGDANESKGFNNTTVANATFDLNVQKVIEGRDFKDGDTFTFTVEPADEGAEIPMPNPATVTITPKSGTTAEVKFGTITFTADDYDPDVTNESANTFRYLVKETPGQANDVLYDQDAHLVTVTLGVGENDELVATAEYDKDADGNDIPVTLTNVSWKGSVDLHFNKYHFGENKRPFNFLLTAVDSNGDARVGDNQSVAYGKGSTIIDNGVDPFTIEVTNDDFDGNKASIDFPKIAYQEKGEYYYLVKENEASVNGMIADEAQYLVHVSVAEDGTAKSTYTLIYGDVKEEVTEDGLDFYNNSTVTLGFNSLSAQSYADGELVRVYPEAEKLLDNEAAKLRGNDFSFQLIDNENGEVITTVSNDENGKIAFFDEKAGDPGLVYDAAGEYTYTIKEVVPEGAVNNVKDGVTYDTNTYTLTVAVTEVDGALVATTKYDGAKLDSKTGVPVFTNTEKATDVVIQKVSRVGGEGLEGATYALYMVGANGDALIQEAVSDVKGYITFKNVTLLPGQQYYFKEVAAPEGHTVDPYRTDYFTPDATCTKLVPSSGTTSDNWHSAKEG